MMPYFRKSLRRKVGRPAPECRKIFEEKSVEREKLWGDLCGGQKMKRKSLLDIMCWTAM